MTEAKHTRFDEAYYERFYEHPRTRVTTPAERRAAAGVLGAWAAYLNIGVASVIDFGCGTGTTREVVASMWPHARYTGVEASRWACARYGWTHGEAETHDAGGTFDVVICRDVMQYLETGPAERAMANIARHARTLLWFDALTREDWERHCDRERTDSEAHLREGRWYRAQLRGHFVTLGGGVFLRRSAGHTVFELERGE